MPSSEQRSVSGMSKDDTEKDTFSSITCDIDPPVEEYFTENKFKSKKKKAAKNDSAFDTKSDYSVTPCTEDKTKGKKKESKSKDIPEVEPTTAEVPTGEAYEVENKIRNKQREDSRGDESSVQEHPVIESRYEINLKASKNKGGSTVSHVPDMKLAELPITNPWGKRSVKRSTKLPISDRSSEIVDSDEIKSGNEKNDLDTEVEKVTALVKVEETDVGVETKTKLNIKAKESESTVKPKDEIDESMVTSQVGWNEAGKKGKGKKKKGKNKGGNNAGTAEARAETTVQLEPHPGKRESEATQSAGKRPGGLQKNQERCG